MHNKVSELPLIPQTIKYLRLVPTMTHRLIINVLRQMWEETAGSIGITRDLFHASIHRATSDTSRKCNISVGIRGMRNGASLIRIVLLSWIMQPIYVYRYLLIALDRNSSIRDCKTDDIHIYDSLWTIALCNSIGSYECNVDIIKFDIPITGISQTFWGRSIKFHFEFR